MLKLLLFKFKGQVQNVLKLTSVQNVLQKV